MSARPEADFRAAVAAALGAAPELIEAGRFHRFSVNGKRGDVAGWCQLFADGRAGVYGDFRAGMSAVWTATARHAMSRAERAELARGVMLVATERRQAQGRAWAEQAPRLVRLWSACTAVPANGSGGDALTLYLRHRLALGAADPLHVPAALRVHPALPYHHEGERIGTWPAMVAAFTGAAGELVTLHRTWLTPDGRKAPTPGPVKKLASAAGPIMGGCIRLVDPAEWTGDLLGVAEGIETALAARCASGVPTAAAYSAGGLAAWQWPRGLRRLVIFTDADEAGAKAAAELRQRAMRSGLSVNVLTPSTAGSDWCDVWAQRAGATA